MRALLCAALVLATSHHSYKSDDDPDTREKRKLRFNDYVANEEDRVLDEKAMAEKALSSNEQLEEQVHQGLQAERQREDRSKERNAEREGAYHERTKRRAAALHAAAKLNQERLERVEKQAGLLKQKQPWRARPRARPGSLLQAEPGQVGPETKHVQEEFQDLDKLQDDILARDKVVDAEIDKLPKSPNSWATPSSFLQTSPEDDEFAKLDDGQEKLAALRERMTSTAAAFSSLAKQAKDAVPEPDSPAPDTSSFARSSAEVLTGIAAEKEEATASDAKIQADIAQNFAAAQPVIDGITAAAQSAAADVDEPAPQSLMAAQDIADAQPLDLDQDEADGEGAGHGQPDVDIDELPKNGFGSQDVESATEAMGGESAPPQEDVSEDAEKMSEKAADLGDLDDAPDDSPDPESLLETGGRRKRRHVEHQPLNLGTPRAHDDFEDQFNRKFVDLRRDLQSRVQQLKVSAQEDVEALKEKEARAMSAGPKDTVHLDGAAAPVQPRDDPTSAAAIFEHDGGSDLPIDQLGGVVTDVHELEAPKVQRLQITSPEVQPFDLKNSLDAAIASPLELPEFARASAENAGAETPVAWLEGGAKRKGDRNPFASQFAPGLDHLHELAQRLQAVSAKAHARGVPHMRAQPEVSDDFSSGFVLPH